MKLEEMEKKLDMLEKKIARTEAMLACRKLLNTYELYVQGADCNGITKNLDLRPEDEIWIDAGMGAALAGPRANLEFFDQRPALARMPGALVEHESVTQVIEIADDLQTAKAIDFCPGYKCLALGQSQVWSMGKYYKDLKYVDGEWKIWHGHWFVVCEADAAYGWLYQNRSYWKECMFEELDSIHNGNITAAPAPTRPGDNYRADGYLYMFPEPPDPYAAWEEPADTKFTRGY